MDYQPINFEQMPSSPIDKAASENLQARETLKIEHQRLLQYAWDIFNFAHSLNPTGAKAYRAADRGVVYQAPAVVMSASRFNSAQVTEAAMPKEHFPTFTKLERRFLAVLSLAYAAQIKAPQPQEIPRDMPLPDSITLEHSPYAEEFDIFAEHLARVSLATVSKQQITVYQEVPGSRTAIDGVSSVSYPPTIRDKDTTSRSSSDDWRYFVKAPPEALDFTNLTFHKRQQEHAKENLEAVVDALRDPALNPRS